MRVVGWVGRQLLPLTVAGLVVLSALGDAAAQGTVLGAPAVAAGDGALTVNWAAPTDPGSAAIAAYDIRYILTSADETDDANWSVVEDVWTGAGELAYSITGLDTGASGTGYDVQVRAFSTAGNGAWSASTSATTADHADSSGSATAVMLQTPVHGRIDSSSDDDYFTFILSEATGVFVYTTSFVSGFLPTTGQLTGTGVSENDDQHPAFRQHGDQLFIAADLTAGTYTVEVEAPQAGHYTLHVQPVPDGSDLASAVALPLNGYASGILDPVATDQDYFRLELSHNADMLFWVSRAEKGMDFLGTLLDGNGNTIATHDDSFLSGDRSKHFFIRKELDPGLYYLKVSGGLAATYDVCKGYRPEDTVNWEYCEETFEKAAAETPGPYTVGAQAIETRHTGFPTSLPLTVSEGTVTAARFKNHTEKHFYTITVDQPTHVAVQVVSHDEYFAGELLSRADEGAVMAFERDETDYLPGALGFILYATLPAGTSYVKLTTPNEITGEYIIRAMEDTRLIALFSTCEDISDTYSDPLYGCQWYLKNSGQNSGMAIGTSGEDINVEAVWAGGNLGEGINIAVVDDGLYYKHDDLKDNVNTSKNHTYRYGTPTTVHERYFTHGTAMAGLIAARDNTIGMRGVAPRASIYAYDYLRNPTLGNLTNAISRDRSVTAVSNNSWGYLATGGPAQASSIWEVALDEAVAKGYGGKGVFFTYAGGNNRREGDYSNLSELANYYAVTAACATTDQGTQASYSQSGPNLWVCAPSGDLGRQGVLSTTPYNRYANESRGRPFSGTSQSTALVSGVAALVRKANAGLTWRDVKLILAASARKNDPSDSGWESGAVKYGSTDPTETYNYNHKYGFGVVDAKAAVDLAAAWTPLPEFKQLKTTSLTNLNLSIPDAGSAITSEITVGSDIDFIEFAQVDVKFSHPSFRDLKVDLVSPSGAVSVLSEAHDFDVDFPWFGSFRFGSARHLGEGGAGTWTLRIADSYSGNAGTLDSWSLTLYGHRAAAEAVAVPSITGVSSLSGSLTVSWQISDATDVNAYDVRRIESNAMDKGDANWTVTENAWTSGALQATISGLTNGTTYDLQVRAIRGRSLAGIWSETVTGTPAAAAGAVPTVSALRAEEMALNVTWAAPASPTGTVTAYDVRHISTDATNKADASWTVAEDAWTTSGGALTYTVTALTDGVAYDVQVRAVVSGADGAWSPSFTATPADFPDSRDDALTVPFNTPIQGNLNGPEDADYFKIVSPDALHTIWAFTTGATDTVGAFSKVLSGNRIEDLEQNDDNPFNGSSTNFLVTRGSNNETIYLKVTGFNGATGPYTLTVRRFEDTDQGRNTFVTIPLGGAVDARIDRYRDTDYYKFSLTQRANVVVWSTGPTNVEADLHQNDCSFSSFLTGNFNGFLDVNEDNFAILLNLNQGTYCLEVQKDSGDFGPYRVHVAAASDPGSTTAAAAALTLGTAGAGRIGSSTDVDWFTFTLDAPGYVHFGASNTEIRSGGLNIKGELFDSASAQTAIATFTKVHDVYSAGFSGKDYLEAGTYYLKVSGTDPNATYDYAVLVANDNVAARQATSCGSSAAGLSDPIAGCQWHLLNTGRRGPPGGIDLNVAGVWSNYKGDGITIAVTDGAVELTHPDLSGNVDTDKSKLYHIDNDYFHATAVAGIVAAEANGLGVRGVAPEATIYSNAVLPPAPGAPDYMDVADAMTRHSDVTAVNTNSWGPPDGGFPQSSPAIWKRAIEAGITNGYGGKGVFYTWAAGNGAGGRYRDNSNLDEYPNFYGVAAVCAVNYRGRRASYSELGANLWVCGLGHDSNAPGIVTTLNGGRFTQNFGGTSAATPMVAGVAALMRQANPDLTWRDIKLILAATARKVDPNDDGWEDGALKFASTTERYSFNHQYGFGLVDAAAAVEAARTWSNTTTFRSVSAESDRDLRLWTPDFELGGAPRPITTSVTIEGGVKFIEFVQIHTHFDWDHFRDLRLELISPSGAVSVLAEPHEFEETTSFFTFYQYDRLNYVFQFGSARHLGEDSNGTWTLRITDFNQSVSYASQNLLNWRLIVYGHDGDQPGQPTIDSFGGSGVSATVTWSAPDHTGASAITSYDLRYRYGPWEPWTEITGIPASTMSRTLDNLHSDREYRVQVRAVNDNGTGPWSKNSYKLVRLVPPNEPSHFTVTPGDRSLGLKWGLPTNMAHIDIWDYHVRYIRNDAPDKDDYGNWTEFNVDWFGDDPLWHVITGLQNGVDYHVQMQAEAYWRGFPPNLRGAWTDTIIATPSDMVGLQLEWVSAASTVNEGVGIITVQAALSTNEAGALPSNFSVDIEVKANRAASSALDHSLSARTLTFVNTDFTSTGTGSATRYRAVKDIVITVVDDSLGEPEEQLDLRLYYPTPIMSHYRGNDASLIITIEDNDQGPFNISLDKSAVSVNEDAGSVTLNVTIATAQDTAPTDDVSLSVSIATDDGTAARDVDYTGVSRSVLLTRSSFTRNRVDNLDRYRSTIPITITIVDDTDDESDESFIVSVAFANPALQYTQGPAASATIIIRDNDTRGVTVSPTSLTIAEGGTNTYAVALNTQPTGDVMVDISSDNTDVTVSSSSLTFTTLNWSAEQTVTVTAGQDADAADDTATVTHDPSGADYNSVSSVDLTVTVTDNNTPGITVTHTSLTVGEGGSGTYTVVLDTQPTGNVTVTIVDPTDNTDVTAEPAALTFTTTNWNSAQTVTVSADQDADTDDDTATVTHTVSGYGSVSSAASVTVTVAEDPTAPYDTNGNGLIDKEEASAAVRGYLSDGTPSKAVTSAVVRRYLSGE